MKKRGFKQRNMYIYELEHYAFDRTNTEDDANWRNFEKCVEECNKKKENPIVPWDIVAATH